MLFPFALFGFFSLFLHLYRVLWLKQQLLRSRLHKQGIRGPPPTFVFGNGLEIKRIQNSKSTAVKTSNKENLSHDFASTLFPCFEKWRKEYGDLFTFSLGNLQILYVTNPNMAKEMTLCASMGLGKSGYLQYEFGPLLGRGILTSNGAIWSHQRKTIAPELSMDKVKGMVNLMVESASSIVKTWQGRIESEGGVAEIRADEDMRRTSALIISKVLFGSSFTKALDLISKFKDIQNALTMPTMLKGLPGYRYIPSENNRKIWKLEKEVRSAILKIVKERSTENENDKGDEQDLLQMIIEGAKDGNLGPYTAQDYVLDNCKNIYFAGLETTAISALWCLILLASHPQWQDRCRAEILEICGGGLPDVDMLRKMKTTTMVVQEVLRLYPPGLFMSREALQDIKLGELLVPKGVNIWLSVHALHRDPELWGPDACNFNPERFANGVAGACKLPQTYLAFGMGPRICAGQNFATIELKIVLAVILSNFSFSLSPKYRHSPVFKIIIQPDDGVNLIVRKV
ncbi:PREDICTED: cytochrome P450 714C2-like [Nelumbo nucifera]|uniref:Cytochrome P450 714C2-like n=1 Tax=Nelumbo nucifera TaxID=4432 RepID=A0A1U8A368_NELNU|nr:PREDICTED: cytochrome P450 714C2-like [Nelumbo nucifera]